MSTLARRLVGATAILALAPPAAADARSVVVAGPIEVRTYDLLLIGVDARRDTLSALFTRQRGRSTQQHHYVFTRGVEVTPRRLAGSLGRYGAVDLRLTGARRARGAAAPPGCTGRLGAGRRGRMTGELRLVADRTYFRTVTAQELRARVFRRGSLRCEGASGPGRGAGPTLEMTFRDDAGATAFTATPRLQLAMRMERPATTRPATVMHLVAARAGGLRVTSGGATVDAAPPWLAGRGIYADGVLSGNMFARFDSIGAVALEGRARLRD